MGGFRTRLDGAAALAVYPASTAGTVTHPHWSCQRTGKTRNRRGRQGKRGPVGLFCALGRPLRKLVRAILEPLKGRRPYCVQMFLVSSDQLQTLLPAVTSQGPCVEEIICKRCGLHASADEDFCGGCGAFLEWEGERVVVDDGPAPLSAPSASDQKPAPPPPPPSGPVAVQPAPPIERPKPPAPRPPARRAEPGDIFCGQCGQPNNPERGSAGNAGTSWPSK